MRQKFRKIFWDVENKIKILELFQQNNWGRPLYYGDSLVFNYYNTTEALNEIQINRDLHEIILKYKLDLNIPIIANNRPIVEINTIIMNDPNLTILTAIKTKPFILLAGISGTGKSRLARTLAFQTCSKEELRVDPRKPGNFELIPVRPNWLDSSELMGYVSRIHEEKYIATAFLKFIAKAWKNLDTPFFLCLDEMNLAPVEQYFVEYLSIIETRQLQGEVIETDSLISKVSFENHALYSRLVLDLDLDENKFLRESVFPKIL